MHQLLLRHLTGSKSGETHAFDLGVCTEVLLGRDPVADVHFGSAQDDLVSRRHARIMCDTADGSTVTITDLGSRNGTFINRRRVHGRAVLRSGDVVQLGAGGPEFELLLDRDQAPVRAARARVAGSERTMAIGARSFSPMRSCLLAGAIGLAAIVAGTTWLRRWATAADGAHVGRTQRIAAQRANVREDSLRP